MWQLWAQIILLALLMSCLLINHWKRFQRLARERHWPCHGIELSAVQSRIRWVRKNFVITTRVRPQKSYSHEQVAASVRETFQRLTCFHPDQTVGPDEVPHGDLPGQG